MNATPPLFRQLLAEFLGTLVLIALGDGVVAMVVLMDKGDYTNITLGWGLAVTMGIVVAGRVSGAHINPAVTLTLAAFRGFPWEKVLPYIIAQVAGALVGAALVYVNFLPAFQAAEGNLTQAEIVGVFATFPAYAEQWQYGLIDQIVGTALLLMLILAITEPRNQPVHASFNPIMIGLVVTVIGISWGGMHGYAINPARDFGPRLFALLAGYQETGFASHAWWVPIVGPLLGGLIGAAVFDCFIRPGLPVANERPQIDTDKHR